MIDFFGKTPDDAEVLACTLRNGGAAATILTWGATLQAYNIAGKKHSLVLGGRDMSAYLGPMQYFGAIVGPVANRIAGGRFVIEDKPYNLDRNERDRTTLHSGTSGFSQRNWIIDQIDTAMCRLVLDHPDGLGGFPGPLRVAVIYQLDDTGALEVEISGETERPVFFSPAFHGYWNLSGSPDLSDHRLQVAADRFLPVDEDQIPVGPPQPVAGTAFDYRNFAPIGPLLDHNFCLPTGGDKVQRACTLKAGGLILEVMTDQPGVQIYNGLHIDTKPTLGSEGRSYGPMAGLAIEPQFWPDTPNQKDYPSSLLLPGNIARHVSRFTVRKEA